MNQTENFGVPILCSTDGELLDHLARCRRLAHYWQGRTGHVEQEIFRRLEERGATAIPSETYLCEAPIRYEYPPGTFTPLKEIFNDIDLAECYTPEHQVLVPEHHKTIPESWETRRVLSTANRLGDAVIAVVESRRVPAKRRLTFKVRDETPAA